MEKGLFFQIITPSGDGYKTDCVSVNLVAADDSSGNGGGSIGIMHGHLPTVIALKDNSAVTIKTEGGEKHITVSGGFAEVNNNVVTIVTEDCV